MRNQSISSNSLPEQAVECILEYIKDNKMSPGDKLPNEFQLAEICKVGRSTIREAIKMLAFKGQVELIRGVGTFVTEQKTNMEDDPMGLQNTLNPYQTAIDYFEVRLIFEPEIAAIAATKATYMDCQKLVELQNKIECCINQKQNHLEFDIEFHSEIAKCCKNEVIYNLMQILVKGIPVFVDITKNSFANKTIEQHKAIVDAIVAGDAIGAKCAMVTHLDSNRKSIFNSITKEKK